MKVVVDSSVWIDFLAARPTKQALKLKDFDRARDVIVGDIVLLEVLRGARDEAQSARYERLLRQFDIRSFLDPELAILGAANYRTLRAKGLTIRRAADVVIGTYCLTQGYALLHNDRDFSVMAAHLGLIEF